MIPFLLLFVCFVVATFFVAKSRASRKIKTITIVGLIFSSVLAFSIMNTYLGRPKNVETIPSKVLVHGFKINKENIELFYSHQGESKLVIFDYQQNMHKALSEGRREGKGKPFELKMKGKEGQNGKKGEKGEKDEGGTSLSLKSITEIQHKLPQPQLPKKD